MKVWAGKAPLGKRWGIKNRPSSQTGLRSDKKEALSLAVTEITDSSGKFFSVDEEASRQAGLPFRLRPFPILTPNLDDLKNNLEMSKQRYGHNM